MFESVWNTIQEYFIMIYRFFAYGETDLEREGVYIVMFFLIGILFILSLTVKSGKGKPINSPFLFILAIALTIFTVTL